MRPDLNQPTVNEIRQGKLDNLKGKLNQNKITEEDVQELIDIADEAQARIEKLEEVILYERTPDYIRGGRSPGYVIREDHIYLHPDEMLPLEIKQAREQQQQREQEKFKEREERRGKRGKKEE
jgi:hypothetical protein